MAHVPADDRTGGAGQQRVSRRSRLFVLVPGIAFVLFSVDLLWEMVRQNVSDAAKAKLPFYISLLPMETAATLATAIAGLIFARAQFARAQRPSLGFSLSGDNAAHELSSEFWEMHVFNGGPGHATVVWFGLRATLKATEGSDTQTDWLSPVAMCQVLVDRGLDNGRDFHLHWLGKGHPLVPVARPKDGFLLIRFNRRVIAQLAEFELEIVIVDPVGDQHERTLDYCYHLPTEIRSLS